MSSSAAPDARRVGRTTEDPQEFLEAAAGSGRLIGIDGGTKTLGLALST